MLVNLTRKNKKEKKKKNEKIVNTSSNHKDLQVYNIQKYL